MNSSTLANSNAKFLAKRAGLLACLAAALLSTCFAASAPAAYKYNQNDPPFTVTGCGTISDLAVDENNSWVYVACEGPDVIKRFTLTGAPANFSFSAPYVSGNAIIGNPGSEEGEGNISSQSDLRIAVDNSNSPNQGLLFLTSTPDVNVFRPTGQYGFALEQPVESSISNYLEGVDVGSDGSIYVFSHFPGGRVSKYSPQLLELKRLYTFHLEGPFSTADIRIDSHGAVWVSHTNFSNNFVETLRKYEPDQFTNELAPKYGTNADPSFKAALSPFVVPNPIVAGGSVNNLDVDPNTDDVYVARGTHVEAYTRGTSAETSYKRIPNVGVGLLTNTRAVDVTEDNHLYASTEGNKVVRFGPGDVIPDVHTFPVDIDDVGHKGATLRGEIELDAGHGGTAIKDCKLEYGTSTAYGSVKQCTPDAAILNFNTDTEVSASTGETLNSGTTYHYRFSAENAKGINYGADKTFIPAFVLKTETRPATELTLDPGKTKASAKLNASFDPDGKATEYKFQYGLAAPSYGLETSFEPGGSGIGVVEKGTVLTDLPPGTEFHYRVIAKNADGETIGDDRIFRTASVPEITGVGATQVAGDSAVLNAKINPVGFATDYHFEYGTTTELGQVIPASPVAIGSGSEAVAVSQKVENLQPGVTYHFRVVAENQWGQGLSDDTTFDFTPPNCPNSHVRQQTRSTNLPDCRAYELVSPGSAGAALLLPSDLTANQGFAGGYTEGTPYINNQGFATSPSRFTFWAFLSSLPGTEAVVEFRDMYMATRTDSGWVTKIPSYHNNDAYEVRRQYCSDSMALCAVHNNGSFAGFTPENSPSIFDYEGKFKLRVPTNIAAIEENVPNAKRFYGGQAFSPDFSHYAFSSDNVPFAPGAVTGGIGSAYDNDIAARTVEIISKLPGGGDIPAEAPLVGQKEFDFRVSGDGSHILMDTPAPPGSGPNRFLYMRVGGGGGITYDISQGNPVVPIGMTRSGDKVLFTTAAQMPGSGDTDTSVDLYAWSEASDESVLLSQGNGNGNTDACSASWGVSKCGVLPLTPERFHPAQNSATSVPGQDDQFAELTGDVYFYSPEKLDPVRPGILGQRNLYIYRNGAVRLVATFDAGTQVERSQISPDGSHAAFLTSTKMTPYNTNGFDQVYTFNPDTGVIRCASCNPSGAAPTKDVEVSQGGRFMTDDGRAFFATVDSLVPRDQNGKIIDVYEYVDGRPQLISSGLAGNDYTGGSAVLSIFLAAAYTGLEHVSRDGTDVYFSSFDTLVDEDLNGEFVKFYDARTAGGFPGDANLGPCAAADECHGPDSSAPASATVTSDSNFGKGGNVVTEKQKKKKKKKKKKKSKSHRGKSRSANTGRSHG